MGNAQPVEPESERLCLHPSVGMFVNPTTMSPRQKVAAVAKVRCLEHRLFEGGRVRRELSRETARQIAAAINDLRSALGWLEINLDGRWRPSHDRGDGARASCSAPVPAARLR